MRSMSLYDWSGLTKVLTTVGWVGEALLKIGKKCELGDGKIIIVVALV